MFDHSHAKYKKHNHEHRKDDTFGIDVLLLQPTQLSLAFEEATLT